MTASFDFSGKTVLVSGGTSGIGAAIARAFASSGARVVAAGRGAVGPMVGVELVEVDVRDGAGVAALAGGLGRLDVLVNAAGVIRRGEEHDPEVFADVLDINLNGMMRV